MAETKTIDILLSLQTKPTKGAKELSKELTDLEKKAQNLQKAIDRVGDGKNAGALKQKLAGVKSEIAGIDAAARKLALTKSLKDAEAQADRTRNKMQKLQAVGAKMALVGAAIIAPFALAVNKYLEDQKQVLANGGKMEANAVALTELQKEWAKTQVEVGRVATEILLPYLTKAVDLAKQMADFAKEHPGAVKAALGIGATLVVLGGMLSTAASIVSTIATIQGLAASAGLASGGAAAAGGAVAGGGALAGLGASIATAIAAAAPFVAIAAAVVIAAEGTRQLMNWALGTNQTWADIGNTAKQLAIISTLGWQLLFEKLGAWFAELPVKFGEWIRKTGDSIKSWGTNALNNIASRVGALGSTIVNGIGRYFVNLATSIFNGLKSMATSIMSGLANLVNAIRSFFKLPAKAEGGMTNGVSIAGEKGREFVLSNSTTKAAENMLGGQLTQQRLLQALSNGGSKRIEYHDNRRIDSNLSMNDRRAIKDDIMGALAGAL